MASLRLKLRRVSLAAPLVALYLVTVDNAAATTANDGAAATGRLLTCQQMEDNCLKFANRAAMATGGGAVPYEGSTNFCYDGYRRAASYGVWPANPPFSFALKCLN